MDKIQKGAIYAFFTLTVRVDSQNHPVVEILGVAFVFEVLRNLRHGGVRVVLRNHPRCCNDKCLNKLQARRYEYTKMKRLARINGVFVQQKRVSKPNT